MIVSRKKAVSHSLPRYFTGKICLRGHLSERNTKSRQCVECLKEDLIKNKESRKSNWRKYYYKKRSFHLERKNKWVKKNHEKHKGYKKNSYAKKIYGEYYESFFLIKQIKELT